jgi:hypothetical protein
MERTAEIHAAMRKPIMILFIAILFLLALSAGLSCSIPGEDYFQSFEEKTAIDRLAMSAQSPVCLINTIQPYPLQTANFFSKKVISFSLALTSVASG